MADFTSAPDFDEVSSLLKERFDVIRSLAGQWADLARLAVQGLPHDAVRLAELEARINAIRVDVRKLVIVASEHFSEEGLELLRKRTGMSKYAWRSYKKKRAVTTRYGFTLMIN